MADNCTVLRNGATIVASGSFVFRTTDKLIIKDVPGINDIEIHFEVDLSTAYTAAGTYCEPLNNENGTRVILKMPPGLFQYNSTGNYGVYFAYNDTLKYYFSYYYRSIGNEENSVSIVQFQILTELHHGQI